MKPIPLRNYRRIDTRSSALHAAAETAQRNIACLESWRRKRELHERLNGPGGEAA